MQKMKKINWLNTIFLIMTPLVGIIGTVILASKGMVMWQTWVLALLFCLAMGFCITAGYHRLFSHRAYKAAWPVRFFFAILGAGAFEGSVLEWSTDHRIHHRYVDTERDPYNIHQGVFHAHIGWLIFLDPSKRDFSNVDELAKDPIVAFQHKYFVPLAILSGFILPMAIGALWGNAFAALIVAGFLRVFFNHHITFLINSLCHCVGKRTYSMEETARDNWVTAFLTLGEGFHNYHHKFPIDYRNGIRFFHFDPTKWLIYGLSLVGLTSNLQRVSDHKILQYKIRAEEARLKETALFVEQPGAISTLKEKIFEQIARIERLEKDLFEVKRTKLKEKIHQYVDQIKRAEQELAISLRLWKGLVYANNTI